jgi:pilus assembly protein TadC
MMQNHSSEKYGIGGMKLKIIDSFLSKNLKKSQINKSPEEYLSDCLKKTAVVFSVLLVISILADVEIIIAIFISALIGIFSLLILLIKPLILKRNLSEKIESEMPFALNSMAVELNINIPFEKAMLNIAREDYGLFSREMMRAYNEIKKTGAGVEAALWEITERYDSRALRRAIMQMCNAYRHDKKGSAGEPLKKIANEMLSMQKMKIKEFSAYSSMLSLVFIAVSAILPALVIAGIVISSSFMQLEFGAIEVILICTLLFPLINIATLMVIKGKTPLVLR